MKKIREFILEKFKINSNTTKNIKDIKISVNKDHLSLSEKEINDISEYCQQLKVIPYVLSNQICWAGKLYTEKNIIYAYFDDKWDQMEQKNYLAFEKDKDDHKFYAEITEDNELKYLKDKYDNYIYGSIDVVGKAFIEQLTDKFYDKVKHEANK